MRFYFGRDWMREEGRVLHLILIERRDLMRPSEEGMLVLAGFAMSIWFRWPWGRRHYRARISYGDTHGWRSPISIMVRSDAGEIAARLAA